MTLLMAGETHGFAERRLLFLDGSGWDDPALDEADFEHGQRLAPVRNGCFLVADEEGEVRVYLEVHDAPVPVVTDFGHAEFDGTGKSIGVRGLMGEPLLTLEVAAPRWHVAARYFAEARHWRLCVWAV